MRKTKKIIAMLIILVMVMAYIPFNVFAIADPDTYVNIRLDNATAVDNANKKITYAHGEVTVDGEVTLEETPADSGNFFLYTNLTSVTFHTYSAEGYMAQYDLAQGPQNVVKNTLTVNGLTVGQANTKNVMFQFVENLAEVQLDGATAVNNTTKTITYANGTVTVAGNVTLKEINQGVYGFTTGAASVTFNTHPAEGYVAWANGSLVQNNTYTMTGLQGGDHKGLSFDFDRQQNNNNNNNNNNNQQNNNQNNNQQNNDPAPRLVDGTVYFMWIDNGSIYYHKITGVRGFENGAFYDNRVKASTIKDDRTGTAYKFKSEPYEFCWKEAFEATISSGALASATNKIEFLRENGITVDPVGAENGANSICTNGNREFRLTIYNDEEGYEGVKVGVTNSDFWPGFLDRIFVSDIHDISGTTKENPKDLKVYLLSDTITLQNDAESSEIASIKALNVPTKAVTITHTGSKYSVKFNSNFYDSVLLEIKTKAGDTNYVRVKRVVLNAHDNFGPGVTNTAVIGTIYYPATTNYNDYEVLATVNYKDGTSTTTKVSPERTYAGKTQEYATVTVLNNYEYTGGDGLKMTEYKVPVDGDTVESVSFNVIEKGALDGTVYGGSFAGSGKGITYNLKTRK